MLIAKSKKNGREESVFLMVNFFKSIISKDGIVVVVNFDLLILFLHSRINVLIGANKVERQSAANGYLKSKLEQMVQWNVTKLV